MQQKAVTRHVLGLMHRRYPYLWPAGDTLSSSADELSRVVIESPHAEYVWELLKSHHHRRPRPPYSDRYSRSYGARPLHGACPVAQESSAEVLLLGGDEMASEGRDSGHDGTIRLPRLLSTLAQHIREEDNLKLSTPSLSTAVASPSTTVVVCDLPQLQPQQQHATLSYEALPSLGAMGGLTQREQCLALPPADALHREVVRAFLPPHQTRLLYAEVSPDLTALQCLAAAKYLLSPQGGLVVIVDAQHSADSRLLQPDVKQYARFAHGGEVVVGCCSPSPGRPAAAAYFACRTSSSSPTASATAWRDDWDRRDPAFLFAAHRSGRGTMREVVRQRRAEHRRQHRRGWIRGPQDRPHIERSSAGSSDGNSVRQRRPPPRSILPSFTGAAYAPEHPNAAQEKRKREEEESKYSAVAFDMVANQRYAEHPVD